MDLGSKKTFSYGFGLGMAARLSKTLTLNPEVTTEKISLGDPELLHLLNKLHLNLNYKLGKNISVYAGPSYAVYYSKIAPAKEGYATVIPSENYHTYNISKTVTSWFGWNAGITIF